MDGSWSLNPVVELRTLFEGLPTPVRRPVELGVFGGDLPRADVSGMRWMAAELRSKAAAMNGHAEDAETILAQEDSLGMLGDRVREILHLHREGAARLREEALALADQAHAAANDAEKTLCVMFAFGIELAWRIVATVSAAAAAGPAGEVAAAPVVESMLVEGRGKVALMRAGLEQAYKVSAATTAARLSALGPYRLVLAVGKAAALPAGVDLGAQLMQVASGDRNSTVKGPNGENPRGIDLKSIEAAAVSGAGGAVGGIAAGMFAPKVFPRLETSRSALGLMQGVAGAVSGLGAAALITGWPENFEDVLASLLSGGLGGVVDVHGRAHSDLGSPLGKVVDGSGGYVSPDPSTVSLSKDAVTRLAGAPQGVKSLTPAPPVAVDSKGGSAPQPVNSASPGDAMGAGESQPEEIPVSSGPSGATGDGQHELDEAGDLARRLADSGPDERTPGSAEHVSGQAGADAQPGDSDSPAGQGERAAADRAEDRAPGVDLSAGADDPSGDGTQADGDAQGRAGAAQPRAGDGAHGGGAQTGGTGEARTGDGGTADGGGAHAGNGQAGGGAHGGGNAQADGGVHGAGGAPAGGGVASGTALSGRGGDQSGWQQQRSAEHGEEEAAAVGGSRRARAPVGDGTAGHEPALARPGSAKVDSRVEVGDVSGRHGGGGEAPARVTAPQQADLPPRDGSSVGNSEDAAADARPTGYDEPSRPAQELAQELVGLPSADPATKQDLGPEQQTQFKAAAQKALTLYRLRREELAGESWEQRRHAMEHGDRVESLLRYIDAMREGTGKTPRWNQIKAFLLGEHGFMRQMGTGQGKSMVGALDTLWQLSRGEPVEQASGKPVRVHHVITTTEVLANEGVREFAPMLRSLGYEVARWDPHDPPVEPERPTVYYMTYDERATAELFDRPPPGKTATIDEADAVLVHNQTVHYQSEGPREIASEVEAAGVYRVRDFLKAVLRSRITASEDLSVHLEQALHDGPLTAEEAGAVRALSAEEVGAARTLSARSLREQPEQCLDTVNRLWERYAGRNFTAEETEMARAFLDVKAGRLKLNRDFQIFGAGLEKKVQILDEYGKPRSDPKIGTESRWFGGRHKMVEAIFDAPVYSDGTGSKQVTVEDVLGRYEKLHLMSGTLERTAAEIKENFPVEGGLAKVEDFGRSKLAGEEDRIFLTEPEKLRDAVGRVQQLQGEGRPVLVICPFNDVARNFSLMLTKAGVEHNAIDARWFADHRDNNAAEEHLLSVKDTAGARGAVTVGTGMLGRGFDVSISDEVDQLGGVHAHMLGRSPTNPDEDHQWSARAGRNGRNGSFCFNVAASDRLYSEAQHHGARVAVTHYRAAVAKHAEATAEYTEATRQVGNTDAAQSGQAVRAARTKVAAAAADVAAAEREMRSLTSPLQDDAADRTYLQRVMRRANQAHAPPAARDLAATSAISPHNTDAASLLHTWPGTAHTAADSYQTGSDTRHVGADVDRAAMDAVHTGHDAFQSHLRGDRFGRLTAWLGIPASIQAAVFDTDDDDDPLSRLLERAGVSSAAVEALNQHLDHAPPTAVMQADALTDEQALNHLTPRRNRLAAELGWDPAQVAGAEGVRQVGAAVDTAREELADLLDLPATEVNSVTARDELAGAVARMLGPGETADDPVTELLVLAASTYLAVNAMLDLTVAIHQRSPKSCVNNGVTMMRVLYPHNEHAYHMPDDMPLRGHTEEDTERAFGGAFRTFGSLEEAAASLKERPGGSQALVYKWLNNGEVESHLVLLVNDSVRADAPNLVVLDIAAALGEAPITPTDLAESRALLNKAVPFQQWQHKQQPYIDQLDQADRDILAIEFDHTGEPLARLTTPQRPVVSSQEPGWSPPSQWSSRSPPFRQGQFALAGYRPPVDGEPPDNIRASTPTPAIRREPDLSRSGQHGVPIGSLPLSDPAAVRSPLPDIGGTTAADSDPPGHQPTGPDPFAGDNGSYPGESTPRPGGPARSDSAVSSPDMSRQRERAMVAELLGDGSVPPGFIGSRPREENASGDDASAGPDFQDLVLAGRASGAADRSLVEDAPGVRVESVTFGTGTRVFAETYTDPIAALEQVLQRKVAEIMDAPVARTCLILQDDTVYREITPGQPGDSLPALDREILGSRMAGRLGLFDAVTRTNRAAREWSVSSDNEVRGGRAPSAINATPTGAFAAMFVRPIDGREVWQHHGIPRPELSAIRERVAYLQSWISDLPVPNEYKPALHHIHGRYMDALAEVEWRAAQTPGEISHRAGLDVEAQAKARLVEAFNLDYPHITIVGFEHPDVPAHVVEEILGALDEMFTRFPGRTNIRGLWIDYLGNENAGAASFAQRDSETTFRTLGIQFSLRNASRPAWTVERGIEMRERGFNPIGDRPFHHDAVHEFVHAIDAVELLSVTLRQVLNETWSRLHELGLIRETEQTWLARLPMYAFVDGTKATLREYEALAVGFAEADIHGAAVGTPQWVIHQYVSAGRPPQITPDLVVESPAQGNRPPSAGNHGFIGSRPPEQSDPSLDASRGAWLKRLRLEQGMKQKDVAQAAGLSNAALSNIENGRRTSLGTFQQVCRALGVGGEALTEATRRFYPDVELETDAAAHDSPGGWVAGHRNTQGMTKADLARAVGVTPTRIGEIENGDRPPPNLFFRIARVLGVGEQALAEATRSLYPDLVLDIDPTAHDPGAPGNWIVALRHHQDATQAEVARTAGTSAGYLAGIEGGEYIPSSIIFRRICRALVAPEHLSTATHHFYPDLVLDLDPTAHDPAAPGRWFVALRHDRDMTRTELAKAIGPGWGHLAHIETGNYVPRFAVFRRICEVLGIDDVSLAEAARHFYPQVDLDLEPAAHDLGGWITALRNDRDMSRAELARVTGLSTKYLAQVETENQRPRFETFRRICRALSVSGGLLIHAVRDFYPDVTADIDPASHRSLGRWIAALRHDEGISAAELAQRARMPRKTVSSIDNDLYLPRLRTLRQLCRAQGVGGELLLEIVERFYADRYEPSGYRDEEELFKRYLVTRVGSPEEKAAQDKILERFAWVPEAVARREPADIRDEAVQAAWVGMLGAMTNHVPSASFAAHAWASCRAAVFRYRLALRFPELDNRTRKLVSTVEAQIHRMVSEGAALEDSEIARRAGLKVADVGLAREILARPILRLDAPISGNDGSRHWTVADPVPQGFADRDFAMTVRAALADMADPATAERLVMLHLVEGMSLVRAAQQVGLPVVAAGDVLADMVVRLRSAFEYREPADVVASEQQARAEPDQSPITSAPRDDSEPGEGTTKPGGFIGSRPPEPGESAHGQASEETPRTTPWSREFIDGLSLTPSETEILAHVRKGITHAEIAIMLDLSEREVRAKLASVRRKLRNQRVRLVTTGRLADPSTTSESDRFRAAMYAALVGADQPDPRQLIAEASQEQLERTVQELGSDRRRALRQVRAGARSQVIRNMALLAARRSVSALAAEHNRSQAVLATALAEASPADLQTALDELTAAERQLLINRFGPVVSPATFDPEDSVRGLRAVDIVRHVATRIATRAEMSTDGETDSDRSEVQPGQYLAENELLTAVQHTHSAAAQTYTTNECLDAVVEWMDRQDPTQADAAVTYRWGSLPVDHGFDDEQRRLADEALRAGGIDDADRLQRWGHRLSAGSAQRRATENGEWWDALSDPAEPGGLSSTQRALIQVYPHQIGNADGLPAVIRDHANRLSIRRELDEVVARRPVGVGMLDWIRTELTAAERKQFSNLIHVRNHLQQLDLQAAEIPGSPPVHLLCYDSTAFRGKGKVVAALGNVDTAHTVNWHVPGTNTTSSSLAYQFKPLRNLYAETLRVDPSLELASIIWIGYDAPTGPVNTGYVKAAFRRRARVGGDRLLCDIAALHATRRRAGTAAPSRLVNRLYGHSYGSVTTCYAGRGGRLAGLVGSITLSGSPGAGPVRHAEEFGLGPGQVYVLASWRDPVTMFGADEPGAWSRFNPRLGLGMDPATEAFGGKRIGAEFPDSPAFAGVEAVHQGYLHHDSATGQPSEALTNSAQITAGRGATLASVDRRRPGRRVIPRPIDSEHGRYADGNSDSRHGKGEPSPGGYIGSKPSDNFDSTDDRRRRGSSSAESNDPAAQRNPAAETAHRSTSDKAVPGVTPWSRDPGSASRQGMGRSSGKPGPAVRRAAGGAEQSSDPSSDDDGRAVGREPVGSPGEVNVPTEWLPSAHVPRTVVSLIRGLLKEGLTRVLEDPSLGPAIITEIGRRFAETDVPLKIGGTSRRLAELFPPDELAYLRYSLERSIASGCLQYKLTETALQQMMHRPERVTAALRSTYSHVEPGYIASWLDDDYVMHGRDGYPRHSGRHVFMQAAVEHLTAVWELVDGLAWQDLAAIKDERTRDRAPILNSIPPHRRAELDLPAHSVDEFDIPGNNTVLSAATNMGSVLIVLRGYLESLAEHADMIEGWPWAAIQHGVLEFASRLSVMAGVTFTTLGDFTEPRHPPRFAVEFDTASRTITSVAITGPAKQARAADRGGVCPGFVTFYPAGEAEVSTDQLRRSLAGIDVEPHRSSSGSNIAMMVGGFLLPLLGRDYPQLRLTGPTLTDLMTGQSVLDPGELGPIPFPVESPVTAPAPGDAMGTVEPTVDSVDATERWHALRVSLAELIEIDPDEVEAVPLQWALNLALDRLQGADFEQWRDAVDADLPARLLPWVRDTMLWKRDVATAMTQMARLGRHDPAVWDRLQGKADRIEQELTEMVGGADSVSESAVTDPVTELRRLGRHTDASRILTLLNAAESFLVLDEFGVAPRPDPDVVARLARADPAIATALLDGSRSPTTDTDHRVLTVASWLGYPVGAETSARALGDWRPVVDHFVEDEAPAAGASDSAPDSGASGLPGAGTGGATEADPAPKPAAGQGESDRPPGLIGSRPPEGFEPIDSARDRRSPRGSRRGSTPPEAYVPVDPVPPHPWRRSLGADHTGPLPDPCAETPHRPAGATPWSGSPGNSPHQPATVHDDS
ncbi:helix-turn-helix domain-containing protein [Nocardia sp. NPDC047654]|uniref:helix-turn-helix domain-containing protein n=1 Tax=Nocardia sp. NPDC047654 TaxID=3364314 RepID=UPI00371D378F